MYDRFIRKRKGRRVRLLQLELFGERQAVSEQKTAMIRGMIVKNYVITIARGYGSGGRTIGKMLAKELDIHYYDQELLRMASDESGISESLFARADERLKTPVLFKAGRKAPIRVQSSRLTVWISPRNRTCSTIKPR